MNGESTRKSAVLYIRVTPNLRDRLRQIAYERGQTLSGMMEHLSRNLVRDADQRQAAEPRDLQ